MSTGGLRRVVGITLDQIRDVPEVIGIATGAEKAAGVAAVLAGGYVNRLVCDQDLAQALLGDLRKSKGVPSCRALRIA